MSTLLGRLFLVLGGGAAGVQLTQNKDNVEVFKTQLLTLLLNTPRGADPALDTKIDGLSAELRALAAANGRTVVVQNGGSPVTRLMYLSVIGGGVYGWMWLKGYTWNDLKWVSNVKFAEAVKAMKTAQEQLGSKVQDFRASAEQALAAFQEVVENRFKAVTTHIDHSVGVVQDQVSTVSTEVRTVDSRVQRMEGKMDSNAEMLERTARGVQLLCNVVAEAAGNTSAGKELKNFLGDESLVGAGAAVQQLEGPPVMVDSSEADELEASQGSTVVAPPQVMAGLLGKPTVGTFLSQTT
mmetsp:Transcript_43425/g.68009  ORF Transcript_43425/g.68009 Transcript_43425/m.68009 type:complete len:296 (+) Transcript_43425:22-909(+)|eukprot:CAMPEP_0184299928 /NCGR_PEP_ID=MMETSP1049-20130417/10450_1 /TAXON_ID=77928 /ORGANISM="Proteomonas sulcata, Strain CCMP704" /LENGTH=295 /DNA_ID=CAMNT_0026610509 /DNA_START=24 /DNA_END=911 /DNA_ORIENTATION=-